MSHDIEQHTPAPSPTRRTVLTGAAWSVPVIAAASLAPFAAASGTPVLAFNQASYSGTACGTITGASVSVTTNGTPTSNVSVTTTLSGGYTFAGGSASYTGVSDGSGKVALPAINVPAGGGTRPLSAATGNSTTSATLIAPSTSSAYAWSSNLGTSGTPYPYPDVPSTAVPLGAWSMYLDGTDIWYQNQKIITGATSAYGFASANGTGEVQCVNFMKGGKAYAWSSNLGTSGTPYPYPDVPSTAVPLGAWSMYLDGTDIWYQNQKIITGATSAYGFATANGTGEVQCVNYLRASC